jgi:hypothetical protein
MANSTSNIDTIASSQASKEVTANAFFDAASPASLYGRRQSTCSGLTWGYYGGNVMVAGVSTAIANGTFTLTGSTTNYIEAEPSTGAVSSNTSGFTAGRVKLYSVVTGVATVTSYTDFRAGAPGNPDLAGVTHAATSKTPPVDADELGLLDSAAGWVLKKLTLTNLWAWAKAKIEGAAVIIGGTTPAAGTFTILGVTGNVRIGSGAASGDSALTVSVNATGATTAYGWRNLQEIQSGVTSSYFGNISAVSTIDAAFTVGAVYGYYASNIVKGAASTITTQIGYYVEDLTVATNSYGFFANISAGTNKWAIYSTGTADSYLRGNVGVGALPTARNNTHLQTVDGLGFPATQVASSDANTLDDYEWGTWTPHFTLSVPGTSSFPDSTNVGRYTKVGRLVTCSFHLSTAGASAGTGTGEILLTGFPFTSGASPNNWGGGLSYISNFTTNFPNTIMMPASTTVAVLYKSSITAITVAVTQADVGASQQVYGYISYEV